MYSNHRPPAITALDITNEINDLNTSADGSLFVVQRAADWLAHAMQRASPLMLFSEFWHEGELCILFADTNLGKSILAVQIGNSISRGEAVPGFKLQAPAQPVLYFDFELSEKQFESRYSANYADHYRFNENFFRAEINADAEIPDGQYRYEDLINASLEDAVVSTGARVLIIDNLTYLKTETERAQNALPLMKHMKALKQRYGLSILALAHTPKRDAGMPLSRNDLQGSKMLMNFCDSAFAIGESHADKGLRYLKQIKQRYTESIYDAENVVVCQTTKPANFLQFEFLHCGSEWDHLKPRQESGSGELEQQVRALLAQNQQLTAYAVAKQLCTDEQQFNSYKVRVSRIMKRLRNE